MLIKFVGEILLINPTPSCPPILSLFLPLDPQALFRHSPKIKKKMKIKKKNSYNTVISIISYAPSRKYFDLKYCNTNAHHHLSNSWQEKMLPFFFLPITENTFSSLKSLLLREENCA